MNQIDAHVLRYAQDRLLTDDQLSHGIPGLRGADVQAAVYRLLTARLLERIPGTTSGGGVVGVTTYALTTMGQLTLAPSPAG